MSEKSAKAFSKKSAEEWAAKADAMRAHAQQKPRLLNRPDGVTGERKGKRIDGHLRGGKQSADWGEATDWLNMKIPAEVLDKVKDLAKGHKLFIWQVMVEAVDCFEREHGERIGDKAGRTTKK